MISGDEYGILNRLLFNQPIEPSPEGILRVMGFVHLYTASGLHLLALENFLQRFCGRSVFTRKILTVIFWLFLFILWSIQDFRLGFARILVLFFLRALARAQGYRWRVYYPLFIAFCFDFALGIESGWQHYYLAILGAMLGVEYARKKSYFVQHLYLSVGSWLMTAPLDLWLHHEISWMTPIWSMFTIPPIAYFLYPMSVTSYFIMGRVPEVLVDCWNWCMGLFLNIVNQGFTFSVVTHTSILFALAFAVVASFVFLNIKSLKNRAFLLVLSCLSVFCFRFYYSSLPALELIQLNVGQGDSLLIHAKNQLETTTEMIDLGTSREVKPEAMIHRLAFYGVTKVDTVLFSHLDEDHAGGLRLLLPWVPVAALEMSPLFERTRKVDLWLSDFPNTRLCLSGCFRSGSVDWISERVVKKQQLISGNSLMATVVIPLSDKSVYLALGDSSQKQEELFWQRHGHEVLKFPHRILKVSHHGSRNSSSDEFIKNVNPAAVVISVGRRNHYHHPHFSVMKSLKDFHIPVHRTDRDGDYIFYEK